MSLQTFAFASNQNIFSIDLSTRFNRAISISVSYEGIFEDTQTFTRLFACLITRFQDYFLFYSPAVLNSLLLKEISIYIFVVKTGI